MFSFSCITVAVLALCVFSVNGFWRLECEGSTGLARLDPLMSFNSIGGHVHSVKGGSAFSSTSKADDLLKSKCTSCGVAQDMSAYWAPAVYFMHKDGTVELVPEKPPHKSYYLMNTGLTHDGKQQTVEPFPNGFQMLAGNNFNRNSSLPDPDPNPKGPWPKESQDQLAQRAIGFNCLHYNAGNNEPTLMRHKMPDKDFLDSTCTDGIRLELQFPSCWNGELNGGPTHKSHVAYPDGVAVGNCPQGYDRRLITLFYETIVATDQFKGNDGRFVLANGDPTGYGYHGDFMAAWKDDTLKKAVEACNQQVSSGVMRECPVFQMTQNSQQCKLDSPLPDEIAKENVKGPMKGLPNGLQVADGPGPAPMPGQAAPGPAPAGQSQQSQLPATQQTSLNFVPAQASAPTPVSSGTQPASPEHGLIQEKVAIKPSVTATSSFPVVGPGGGGGRGANGGIAASPPASTPAPSSPPEASTEWRAGKTVTTTVYSTQQVQAPEEVVITSVTVTSVHTSTVMLRERAHENHLRRHVHRHRLTRGLGGAKRG